MQVKKLKQSFRFALILLLILISEGCSVGEITNYQLGLRYYDEGKYRTSLEYFTRAIFFNPNNARLYYLRANANVQLGNNNKAIQDYSRAIKLLADKEYFEGRGLTYLASGRYQFAINDFDSAIILDSTLSELYFDRGYTNSFLGDYDSAISDYSKAIQLDSTNAKTYVNRGEIWSRIGHSIEAIDDFTIAINLVPEDELAYYNRANEFVLLGKYQQAIDDFSNAIILNPENAEYYFLRANAKTKLNKFLSATEDYSLVIELEPGNGNAYYNRGICYANINLKDDACNDLNRAGELGFFEAYEVIKKYCEQEVKKKKK